MADCSTYLESIGVYKATLFENKRVQFNRPDIANESEVNIINYEGSGILIGNEADPAWVRTRSLGQNRKQLFNDVLNFNLKGLNDENRDILKLLRESTYGFIMQLELNNGTKIIFQTPVYLRNETTLNYNNGITNVSLNYSVPAFHNYLTYLDDLLGNQSGFLSTENVTCEEKLESIGVNKAVLYINDNLKLIRPDISKENEIDLINYGGGAIIIENTDDPVWTRRTITNDNYKEAFDDSLQFNLYGLTEENELIIQTLYEERRGFIMELQLNNNQNIIFPTPIFLTNDIVFDYNNGNAIVNINYAIPTMQDYLIKLNDLVFAYSFILVGTDSVLGYTENGDPIVTNF